MKKLGIIVFTITLLTWGSIGQASILATFNIDGGLWTQTSWDGSQLTVTGTQQSLLANASGTFVTQGRSRRHATRRLSSNLFLMTPSRSSYSTITQALSPNNYSGVAWNGYQIWVSSTDGTPISVLNPTVDMYQASTDQTIYDWTINAQPLSSSSWVLIAAWRNTGPARRRTGFGLSDDLHRQRPELQGDIGSRRSRSCSRAWHTDPGPRRIAGFGGRTRRAARP